MSARISPDILTGLPIQASPALRTGVRAPRLGGGLTRRGWLAWRGGLASRSRLIRRLRLTRGSRLARLGGLV